MERSKLMAMEQAQSQLDTIVALWDAQSWATDPNRRDQAKPCQDTWEVIQSYDMTDPDDSANREAVSDGVWDAIMNLPLSRASITGTWIDGEEPQATSFRIPLCLGGPSVWMCGEFDERSCATSTPCANCRLMEP